MEAQKKLLKQVVNVIIAIQGQHVTEGVPDTQKGKILYTNCHEYVKSDRFNIDFRKELLDRREFFLSKFDLSLAISNDMKSKLLETEFPLNEGDTVSSSDAEQIWRTFSEIKAFIRNECLPKYKTYLKTPKSGNYTDDDTLKDIMKEVAIKQIVDNKTKVKYL
jgi:hypothetical protein